MTGWDVLVIGAGAAGCALAGTLLRDPSVRVCLVEAGMARTGGTAPDTWAHRTALPGGGGLLRLQQGRGLGGSSGLQGGRSLHGHPDDWRRWEAVVGQAAGAALAETRTMAARRLASAADNPVSGPDALLAFLAAAAAAGWPPCGDFNRSPWEGAGPAPDGPYRRRWDSGFERLREAVRDRGGTGQLDVLSGMEAEELLFDGPRCAGVRAVREDGGRLELRAGTTVLCAGAIGTPALLLRSGIGPPDQLGSAGTPVRRASPAVGRELRDHPAVWLTQPAGPTAVRSPGPEPLLRSYGTARPGLPACAVEPGWDRLDRQARLVSSGAAAPPRRLFVVASLLHPPVLGEVGVRRGPGTQPVAELRLYPGPAASARSLAAVGTEVLELLDALGETGLVDDRPVLVSRRALARGSRDGRTATGAPPRDPTAAGDVAAVATTAHHWHGSAPAGTDPGTSVCDGFGRVHGVPGLVVADASTVPVPFRANTHFATEVVAELAGSALLRGWPNTGWRPEPCPSTRSTE